MKDLITSLIVFTSILLLTNCEKDNDNTETFEGFESYRFELWKTLLANNFQFDFIGNNTDNGTYSEFLDQTFDREHEGNGGIDTEGVLNSLNYVLNNIETPDLVLLGIGLNDLADTDVDPSVPIANINQIIDELKNNNPNVTIILEQIAPGRSDFMSTDLRNRIESFNDQIITVAIDQNDMNSSIIAIDMYTGFSDAFFADELHYNAQGATFVSNKYFDAIQANISNVDNLNILPLGDSRVEGNRR